MPSGEALALISEELSEVCATKPSNLQPGSGSEEHLSCPLGAPTGGPAWLTWCCPRVVLLRCCTHTCRRQKSLSLTDFFRTTAPCHCSQTTLQMR